MPKVFIKKKAEIISEYQLNTGKENYLIGAGAASDIVIADKLVSQNHSKIVRNGNKYFLYDCNSAFGTFINGEKVEDKTELKTGDSIQVGDHTVLFDDPLGQVEISSRDFDSKIEAANNGDQRNALQERDRLESEFRKNTISVNNQKNFSENGALPYKLLAVYGPYAGKTYQLKFPETKIGRDNALNDIVLNKNKKGGADNSISRRHATISCQDGGFMVADKRSKTRTFVNRQVVPENESVKIRVDDELEIVSDQQSTIFRLVQDSTSEFKFPRKAGVWWVRYQSQFAISLVLLTMLASVYFIVNGLQERNMITQKPTPFALEVTHWSTDKSVSIQGNIPISADSKNISQAPIVADFNNDGVLDIITTNLTQKPFLIDGISKEPKWFVDTLPVWAKSALTAADVNQNQLPDLIYLTSDRRIVAIDGQLGAEIWTSPFFEEELTGPPVVDDIDGDGMNDVAIADVHGNIHIGYNRILEPDWVQIETGIPMRCPMTSADLNMDGTVELVCGTERGIVLIVDGVKREILGSVNINEELNQALGSLYEDNQIRFPVSVSDFNGDESPDLVMTTTSGRIIAIDGSSKERLWHDVLLLDPKSKIENRVFPYAMGDFDGDGLNDVVTASEEGEIRAYRGYGIRKEQHRLWTLHLDESSPILQNFLVADITKDRIADVVYIDEQSMLRLLDGNDGETLTNSAHPTALYASMPLAADLENDGLLDIFLTTYSGIVIQYKSNSRIPKGTILWGQQYSKPQNTAETNFKLPDTLHANLYMGLGVLLLAGGGIITVRSGLRKKWLI